MRERERGKARPQKGSSDGAARPQRGGLGEESGVREGTETDSTFVKEGGNGGWITMRGLGESTVGGC